MVLLVVLAVLVVWALFPIFGLFVYCSSWCFGVVGLLLVWFLFVTCVSVLVLYATVCGFTA